MLAASRSPTSRPEIAQQLEIVLDSLAETETGIDDDALASDAARLGSGDALGEKRADLRHHVAVARPALHRARLSPHVHEAHPGVGGRHRFERAGRSEEHTSELQSHL